VSTMDPMRAANPPTTREPSHRGHRAHDSNWWSECAPYLTPPAVRPARGYAESWPPRTSRAPNCVGLRRRIEDLVKDLTPLRSSAVRWPVAGASARPVSRSDRRSRLRPAGDRHRLVDITDTATLRADSGGSGRVGPHDQSVHPSVAGGGSRYSTSPVSAGSASADTMARRPRLADARPSLFNCSRARWAVPADTL
jgi:hypothetical protein